MSATFEPQLLPFDPVDDGQADQPEGLISPRLFRATGHRVTPHAEWVEIQVKSAINRVQNMGFDWSINPYRGCAHACPYCFARVTHWYLDQDGVNTWSSRIFVKVNAPSVLRKELARPSWRREEVNIGTATDPYQAAEGKYRLTRQILEALRDFDTPAALITKSAMVVRDKDVLAQLARGPGATVCFSFTTIDDAIAGEVEPDVPPPMRRMEAMRALIDAGVSAGVILAPVLPGITDNEEHLTRVVQAAKDHGAQFVSANLLHLGDVVRQAYFKFLEEKHPELIPEYERLYPKRYAPRADQQRIRDMVAAIKARLNFDSSRADSTSRPHIGKEPDEPVQTRLL